MRLKNKIIAIVNHKGGCSKTTTATSVGSIMAGMGKHVLLVDLDAQANLTISLLGAEVEESIFYALKGEKPLPIEHVSENLDIVPASLQLAMADIDLASAISREKILMDLLEPVKDNYDYIILDCPPHLGLMTLNALAAADEIIIPIKAEVLPFKGLKTICQFTDTVRKRLNPSIRIAGVLITQWENTRLSKTIEKGLRDNKAIRTFNTKIRKNVTIAEAPLEAKSITDYDARSNGAKDYKAFTDELLDVLEKE